MDDFFLIMPPTTRKTKILLAARAGLWRNALESLLQATPDFDVFSEVNDMGDIEIFLCKQSPETLILEAALCGGHLVPTLKRIVERHKMLSLIIIVDSVEQQEAVEAAGVGQVLMKSMLHNQLDVTHFYGKQQQKIVITQTVDGRS